LITALESAIESGKAEDMTTKQRAPGAILAPAAQTAIAAPNGWHEFTGNRRDDASTNLSVNDGTPLSHNRMVSGVFPRNFTSASEPSDPDNDDASFHVEPAVLGSKLAVTIDPGSAFGLYDWCTPALDNEATLSSLQLLSWPITQANQVPERSTMLLMLSGRLLGALQPSRVQPAP
jgi:hypothetical protein